MARNEIPAGVLGLFLADVLSREQDAIDEMLVQASGTWWFDCDCECELDHGRVGLLLVVRYVFGNILKSREDPTLALEIADFIYGLTFLMIESDAFQHFPTFREQFDSERAYATNWLLLGRLASDWKSLMLAHGASLPCLSLLDVFALHATRLD